MRIEEVLDPGCVQPGIDARDKKELLRAIASLCAGSDAIGGTYDSQALFDQLWRREQLGSTGFGNGIAIPHCRLDDAPRFLMGLVTTRKAVEFDSIDGKKTDLLAFVMGPSDKPREHVQLLSSVAQLFRNAELCNRLRAATSSAELVGAIRERSAPSPPTAPAPTETRCKLVHVFIEDEAIFEDILQVFAADEFASSSVIESNEVSGYLTRMPLFAGFWDSSDQSFSRVIVGVVREELVNATIRNIEYISGPLTGRTDILLTVTDIDFCSGSLGRR
ncbi:PTS sugar transporter subunit IIA [Candidatus Fermentibacterales bacterium]|nr:PTS sugar transporter subunit IIA [Candidatus Fermentibacterales bacterium]